MVNLELKEILERYINGATITNQEYDALKQDELINSNDELTDKGDKLLATKE